MTAWCFQSTFDFFKMSSEAGINKIKEMKRNYEISDVGFILLIAVLIAMLFFICCVFMCMGKVCIAVTICIIALIIVVIAAFMWTNRDSQQKSNHQHEEE